MLSYPVLIKSPNNPLLFPAFHHYSSPTQTYTMAALSLILLPMTTEASTPTKNEKGGSSSVSQQPYDHLENHNVYQTPQYQYQHQYPPSVDQTCCASTPEDTIIPNLSPTQSKDVNELVFYQRCWEAIHQRTIKQLEWVKGWWPFTSSVSIMWSIFQ
jgi:hypothetical protein